MQLRVVIAASGDGKILTTAAECRIDEGETVDRRETLLALGDQARLQFEIMTGKTEAM